jgi:hypothetical protein
MLLSHCLGIRLADEGSHISPNGNGVGCEGD